MLCRLAFVILSIIIRQKNGLKKGNLRNRFRKFTTSSLLKTHQLLIFVQIQSHEQKSNFNDSRRLGEIARSKSFCH